MGKLFASAANVLLWLGESDTVSKKAFHAMRYAKQDQAHLESMFLMLRQPWFQRAWVIQEIALGRYVQACCGDDLVDFPRMSDYVFDVWKSFTGLGDYDRSDAAMRGLWCMTWLIHLRREYQLYVFTDQPERGVCYETQIQAAFHCNATDRRDMIFAIRGIAHGRSVPKPDYSISEEQVFTKTAEGISMQVSVP